jgi:5-methylcytosine-specific restriction endonuclease McrA
VSESNGQERSLVSGSELPDVVRDVVDFLFPELRPYEATLYIYLLRHSVVQSGTQHLRVSRRGLQQFIKSSYAGRGSGGDEAASGNASYETVRITLERLESIGAIRKEAEPNREGTLYRVLLPEEIPICQKAREQYAQRTHSAIDVEREADFYNVRENRLRVYERDNYKCRYCSKQLTRFTASLDHVTPVAAGGDNSLGNLITACIDCNSRKNVRPLGDFLAEQTKS